MRRVDKRNLIIVARVVREVRQREQARQDSRLWTDSFLRNDISRERLSGCGIDDRDGLSERRQALRKIAIAFSRSRHSSSTRIGISILRALISQEKLRSVIPAQAGEPQRSAKIERSR